MPSTPPTALSARPSTLRPRAVHHPAALGHWVTVRDRSAPAFRAPSAQLRPRQCSSACLDTLTPSPASLFPPPSKLFRSAKVQLSLSPTAATQRTVSDKLAPGLAVPPPGPPATGPA